MLVICDCKAIYLKVKLTSFQHHHATGSVPGFVYLGLLIQIFLGNCNQYITGDCISKLGWGKPASKTTQDWQQVWGLPWEKPWLIIRLMCSLGCTQSHSAAFRASLERRKKIEPMWQKSWSLCSVYGRESSFLLLYCSLEMSHESQTSTKWIRMRFKEVGS